MVRHFNMMFYFIYRFMFKIHIAFNYINPIVLVHRITHSKKNHEDYMKKFDSAMKHPEEGVSSMIASGLLIALYFFATLGVFNLIIAQVNNDFNYKKFHFLLLAMPSLIMVYILVLKEDKYLNYFEEFKKFSKKKAYILSFLYLMLVVGIISIVILSFIYRNSLKN